MALRGRPASTAPADTASAALEGLGVSVSGANRRDAVGALAGLAAGLGVGIGAALVRATGFRPGRVVGPVAGRRRRHGRHGRPHGRARRQPPARLDGHRLGVRRDPAPGLRRRCARNPGAAGWSCRARSTPRRARHAIGAARLGGGRTGVAGPRRGDDHRQPGRSCPAPERRPRSSASSSATSCRPRRAGSTTAAPGRAPPRVRSARRCSPGGPARDRSSPRSRERPALWAAPTPGRAWRRWAIGRMPDWQAALLEDAVALGAAAVACLPGRTR